MSKFAILCSCGFAASVLAASGGVNTGLAVESSFRTSGSKGPVVKSDFTVAAEASQRDIDFEAATVARKSAALADQVARASVRTAFADARTPNFFYFNNVAIPLNLKPQMALLIDGGAKNAVAAQALANAGVPIKADIETAADFVVVNLVQGARTTEEMRAMIDKVLATGLVAYAAPVFDNELVRDGFRIPTPNILIRSDADQSKSDAMPAMVRMVEAQIGPSQGVSQLRSSSQNGFDVMAQANTMHTAAGIRWSTPQFVQSMKLESIPDDTFFPNQWQHRQNNDIDMDTDAAWDICVGSPAIKTAIFDTGIQLNHPDLNVLAGRDFTTGAVNGTGNGSPIDACDNHGTAVAGCVSGIMDNATGVAGGAPGTFTIAERIGILNSTNCRTFSALDEAWLVNAINYALNQGARVTNSSFTIGYTQALSDAYNNTAGTMVHVASTGNDGVDTIGFPSSEPLVVAVGGFNSAGDRYGNYGAGIDVVGPSVSVPTTDRTGSDGYSMTDYANVTGTSFSSPLTASIAALFLSEYPFATPFEVRSSISFGCVDIGLPGIDTFYGWGRINANNTLMDRVPANYDCAHATVIPSVTGAYNPAVVSTRWAINKTVEQFESCEAGGVGTSSCVYYSFTPPSSGYISLNTNGSDYDTVISVFDSCAGAQLACDDDSGNGTQSQLLNVPVVVGQPVIIKVAKYGLSAGGGNLDFNLSHTPTPPANDLCENAIDIPFAPGVYNVTSPVSDSLMASVSACENDELCGAASNGHSVWYTFTAPADGSVNIDTELSTYDTVLSVFSGCAVLRGECDRPPQIACNDDFASGVFQSRIANLNVTAGQTYLVKVAAFNATAGGATRVRVAYNFPALGNDHCDNATLIPGGNGPMAWSSPLLDTRAASVAACESTEACGYNNGKSVWWEFEAHRNGYLTVDTEGSADDTVLSMFSICAYYWSNGCNLITAAACNDDAGPGVTTSRINSFRITQNMSWTIKLSSFNNIGGLSQLNVRWVPDCPADFNNDNSVDFFDYLDFVDAFSAGATEADFNADGAIDFFDYLDFVDAFSIGC